MSLITKKTEKLQKKFKVFFDSKIKAKTRISALRSYLENVDVAEKRKVCLENYDLIFSILLKIFQYKHERLQALREKSDKPINPNNKELVDILKVMRDSMRLLDFCLESADKNCEAFDNLVEKSIKSNVSYRIRVEGLSLLLLYINITHTDNPKYINLYKNAVHLDDFGTFPFPEPVDIATRNLDNLSESILSGKVSRIEQSIEKTENEMLLFNIILDNILYLLYKQKNYPEIISNKNTIVNESGNKEKTDNDNSETNENKNENDEKKEDEASSKGGNESETTKSPCPDAPKSASSSDDKDIIFDDAKIDFPLNIVQDDNSINTLNYMWSLFQTHYLDKLFPGIAINEVEINHCFSICPSIILKHLLDYIVLIFSIINENNGTFLNELSKNTFIYQYLENSQQDEIPILNKNFASNGLPILSKLYDQNGNYSIKQLILSRNNVYASYCHEVNVNIDFITDFFFKNMYRENLLFEVFRQSLLQGYDKYEVIAETISIINTNIFMKSNHIYDKREPDYVNLVNRLTRKFIKGIRLVFLDRKAGNNKYSKEKIYIYTKVFYIYQYIVTQTDIRIEDETWKTILSTLLEIHDQILIFNKNTLYAESKDAIRLLVETMFYVWTQSPIMEEEYWINLKKELSVSINEWEQVIDEWNKIMTSLTYNLSQYAFNLDINEQRRPDNKFKRNRSKSCVEGCGPNNIPISYVGENDNKKQYNNSNSIGNSMKYNNKTISISNNNSQIISELNKNEIESKKIQYNIKRKLSKREIMNIWKNTLCVIGNPNKIKQPSIYTTCMEGLEKIWNLLEKIRNNQNYANNVYPPILEFSSWIFQAVDTPKELLNGKVVAFRIMCKMMFHKFEYVKEKEYYLHFYLCILKGLQSGEDEIIFEIFDNCKSLYSNYLPGSSILIPPFIKAIKKMIPSRLESLPSFFFQNCIILLNSIYTWCNLYKNKEIPCFEFDDQEYNEETTKKTTFLDVRVEIFEILSSIHSTKNYQNYIKSKKSKALLSNMHFRVVFEELINPELEYKENDNNRSIISEYVLLIMQQMNETDSSIVLNAINSMDTLSQNYYIFKNKLPSILNEVIIANFLGIIDKHLKSLKNGNDDSENIKSIISKIMFCFLNWLMVIPYLSKSTWIQIFEILEKIYNLPDDDNNDKNQQVTDTKNKQKLSRGIYSQHEIKLTKLFDKKVNSIDSTSSATATHSHSFTSEKTNPDEKRNILKSTAEYLINHILHFLASFPTSYGPSTQESTINEEDLLDNAEINSTNYIFFSINDTSIVTFQELSKRNPLECQNRCIIRNLTGKYVWDSNLFFESLDKLGFLFETKSSKLKSNLNLNKNENNRNYPINYYSENIAMLRNNKIDSFEDEDSINDVDDDPYNKSLKSPYNDNFNHLPKYNINEYTDSEDAVENLLLYISQKHPECLVKPNTYLSDIVTDFPEHQLSNLEKIKANEIEQLIYEKGLNIERRKMIDMDEEFDENDLEIEYDESYFTRNKFGKEIPISANSVVFPYQFCRLYMVHTGLFLKQIIDSKKKVCMLNNTKALIRDIKGLDKKNGRETIKIGIIYIKLGQETEQSIMENENGSDEYNQFVLSLGWEIDLEKHNGYAGGLDKNKTKESKAIYYCDSTLEIIFHDITKFPNDPSDTTHIKKKRHIGNDQIHIIWNEHNRNYRSNTIGGDFGNIQIIINPLNNGLYSVYVRQDDMNIILGPLSNTMLVSKYALGPLVRATAIYAYRQIVYQDEIMHYHPYNQRLDNIKTIINRHQKKNFTFDYLLNYAFMNKEEGGIPKSTLPSKNTSVYSSTASGFNGVVSPKMSLVSSSGVSSINSINNAGKTNKNSADGSNQNSSETIASSTSSKLHHISPISKLPSATFSLKKKRNISTTAIDALIQENDSIAVCEDVVPPPSTHPPNGISGAKEMKTSKSTLFV